MGGRALDIEAILASFGMCPIGFTSGNVGFVEDEMGRGLQCSQMFVKLCSRKIPCCTSLAGGNVRLFGVFRQAVVRSRTQMTLTLVLGGQISLFFCRNIMIDDGIGATTVPAHAWLGISWITTGTFWALY